MRGREGKGGMEKGGGKGGMEEGIGKLTILLIKG